LHAVKPDTSEARSYRVDRIESVKVTNKSFQPRYEIEFSPVGIIHAKPTQRTVDTDFGRYSRTRSMSSKRKPTTSYGMKYVFQCGMCQKKFVRSKYDTQLNAHKNQYGMNRSGRIGYFMGNK
jgi:hypothetical protein